MNGIELAHELRNFGYQMQIIFTTNLEEYAFEGYNVSALNYLMKPIEYSDCFKTLNRAKKQLSTKEFYLCKTSGVLQKILYEDILYIEMVSHDAIITTTTTTLNETLSKYKDADRDIKKWLELVEHYKDITELTRAIVYLLIDHIEVGETANGFDGIQEVTIHYRFIGNLLNPTQKAG